MNRSRGRNQPVVTYLLLGVSIAVYLYTLIRYGTTRNSLVLIEVGANFTPLVLMEREWWRMITAGFIHIGFDHILMNGISLYYLGKDLEQVLGSWRYLVVYIVAVIGGNLFSLSLSPESVSAGASTGIFGLFAAFIVLSRLYSHNPYLQERGATYMVLVAINAINGIVSSSVDNWGHIGGFVYGALATYLVALSANHSQSVLKRLGALAAIVIISLLLIIRAYRYLGLPIGL